MACPDITIVIPIHNAEDAVARCLQSIADQTYPGKIEVICVDDSSSDGSLGVIREFSLPDNCEVRIFRNESNLGPGLSRDRGIREATGQLLMFCDSDDYLAPEYLDRMVKAFNEAECDILIGAFTIVDGTNERVERLPASDWTVLNFSAPWGKLYRRTFIEAHDICFKDYRFAEDTYFTLCAFLAGAKYGFTDIAGYYYVQSPESLTRGKAFDQARERELSRMYHDLMSEAEHGSLSSYEHRLLEYSYISDMLNTLLIYGRGCGRGPMSAKADFFLGDLRALFPEYRGNPYIGFLRPRGQRTKIRLGMGAFGLADRLGLSKAFLMLFA